jgi:hypothetical protein
LNWNSSFGAVVLGIQIGDIVTVNYLPFRTVFQFHLNLHPDLTYISLYVQQISIVSHPAIPFFSDVSHIAVGLPAL